jgi:2-succinyl-6-hydroxy-2,4-cyclohexadiene-1-carboxylate synthase
MPETLVLLHGFGGTHRAWDPVLPELDHERYNPLVPDLRGHGTKAAVRPISFEGCVADVLAAAPDKFVLCGYSLGGRVAQRVALAAPERVTRLILVSTSGGISDDSARAARVAADERLADEVTRMSIEEFADHWMANPLFEVTFGEALRWWREDLLRNDPVALAEVLRAVGGGAMAPLWERIGTLTMPVTIIVGGLDPKFMNYAERFAELLPQAEVCVIDGAGHGLPREAPHALAALIAGAA